MFSLSPLPNPEKNQAIIPRTKVGFAPLGKLHVCLFERTVNVCVYVWVSVGVSLSFRYPLLFLNFRIKTKQIVPRNLVLSVANPLDDEKIIIFVWMCKA